MTTTLTPSRLSQLERLAHKRARAKMGWFIHATVYTLVNACLAVLAVSGDRQWHLYPLLGWGLGLTLHGIAVFWLSPGAPLRETLVQREMRRLLAQEKT
ncbi:2TM domain-containing protein [Ottowia thiooxydans]|uniref:2TM domain-containing protein n=1 Tax=Ottowia thiooxydans TaxID=219182 RepID=UPI0004253259|nr:2TM domain-containing protein [Ottowia thiooxydans]